MLAPVPAVAAEDAWDEAPPLVETPALLAAPSAPHALSRTRREIAKHPIDLIAAAYAARNRMTTTISSF
jgi:hypothetical protein